jgi:hypothetical protein
MISHLHRMPCRHALTPAGLTLTLAFSLSLLAPQHSAQADLLRPGATQSFPDTAGQLNGTLSYQFDPVTGVGTLQVNSAPAILAIGPNLADEVYVNDPPNQSRSETIQVKVDASGDFLSAASGNLFTMYGTVTVGGKTYSGLLLQGTPSGFGYQSPAGMPAGTAAFDLNVNLTGGQLKGLYGPDAYIRISPEIGSTFTGDFTKGFSGLKVWTNVRAYNAPTPSPASIPEPATVTILLVCSVVAIAYRHRRGALCSADLNSEG